jgi:hypothetical protein
MSKQCAYDVCIHKAKPNGVCGYHKQYTLYTSNEDLAKEIDKYAVALADWQLCAETLEQTGINILALQSFYNNNLTKSPDFTKTHHGNPLIPFTLQLESLIEHLKELIKKYPDEHQYIYNTSVRLNHASSIGICSCVYCQCMYK